LQNKAKYIQEPCLSKIKTELEINNGKLDIVENKIKWTVYKLKMKNEKVDNSKVVNQAKNLIIKRKNNITKKLDKLETKLKFLQSKIENGSDMNKDKLDYKIKKIEYKISNLLNKKKILDLKENYINKHSNDEFLSLFTQKKIKKLEKKLAKLVSKLSNKNLNPNKIQKILKKQIRIKTKIHHLKNGKKSIFFKKYLDILEKKNLEQVKTENAFEYLKYYRHHNVP